MFVSSVVRAVVAVTLVGCAFPALAADDWHSVRSSNGKASVLFPVVPSNVKELKTHTPGGTIVTRVAEYQDKGIILTISDTKLPRLVEAFGGPQFVLDNSKKNVLSNAFGREISSQALHIKGAKAALVMHYDAAHLWNEKHPGFAGLAMIAFVGSDVYVVNSMISKDTPGNEAMQEKMLKSFRVER